MRRLPLSKCHKCWVAYAQVFRFQISLIAREETPNCAAMEMLLPLIFWPAAPSSSFELELEVRHVSIFSLYISTTCASHNIIGWYKISCLHQALNCLKKKIITKCRLIPPTRSLDQLCLQGPKVFEPCQKMSDKSARRDSDVNKNSFERALSGPSRLPSDSEGGLGRGHWPAIPSQWLGAKFSRPFTIRVGLRRMRHFRRLLAAGVSRLT